MTIKYPVILSRNESGVLKWPDDLPLPDGIDEHRNRRFQIETRGPWQVVTKLRALAVTTRLVEKGVVDILNVYEYTVHGDRNLSGCRESGYCQEGWTSIAGSKRSAFTSEITVEHKGLNYYFAVLYCRDAKNSQKSHVTLSNFGGQR